MRLLLTGDWHIRHTSPEKRTDDYWSTMRRKLEYIMDLAVEKKVKLILQPGDFFDSHKANDFLKRYIIQELRRRRLTVVSVYGQHDLRYHSSEINNTPLAVLNAAEVVYTVSNTNPVSLKKVKIWGASWFEDIPTEGVSNNYFNILLTHRMIIENEKIWEGQEDYELGNVLLKTTPFDVIVSGDNHRGFLIRSGKRLLVNCGSLMRSSIDQINHKPVAYVMSVEDGDVSLDKYEIPIDPFEQVFDMEKAEEEKQKDEKMEAFISRLTSDTELKGLDFIRNIHSFMRENKGEIDSETRKIIEEVMKDE